MKKYLSVKNAFLLAFCVASFVAITGCGASNNGAGLPPLATGAVTACVPGADSYVGCLTANPQAWAETCVASGGAVTTSPDGTTVCETPFQQTLGFEGPGGAVLGPDGGEGIAAGQVYPGDSVTVNASGAWGNNTCDVNFCFDGNCTCTCSGGASVADPNQGLYGDLGGTMFPIQPSATFQDPLPAGGPTEYLYVGFNDATGSTMTCYEVVLNVNVIRCYDINGLTHACPAA